MSTTLISVARLIELAVPRSWQEVVAVVLGAAEAHQTDGRALTAADCFVTTAGTVHLTGAPARLDADTLAGLLADLLEGQTAPPDLRALAAPPEGSPSVGGLHDLMQALAYFERPDRKADIAALASRALVLDAGAHAQSELDRLRSAPRAEARAPVSRAAQRDSEAKALFRRRVAAAALLALVLAAAGLWYLRGSPTPASPAIAGIPTPELPSQPAPPPSTVQTLVTAASEALTSAAGAGLRAIGLAPPVPASDDAPTRPTPEAATRAASRPARRASGDVPGADNATRVAPGPAATAETTLVTELPIVAADPEEGTMPPEVMPGPFTAADSDVEPPVLIYPQLRSPTEEGPPPASTPHFELLVNETGQVEQVRLRATSGRFQDRMMVSAAKAWRFRPAMKDGRPVRYRVRVPLTP